MGQRIKAVRIFRYDVWYDMSPSTNTCMYIVRFVHTIHTYLRTANGFMYVQVPDRVHGPACTTDASVA